MALSTNLKRPKQFHLHLLLWQDFVGVVRGLGSRLLGSSLSPFKSGADGGRDARFEGTPNDWPSKQAQEHGQYVIQCKHTSRAGACCSEEDFKKLLRKEVPKVKTLVAGEEMSHYMVFTNRTKPADADQAFRDRFAKIKGLAKAWLLGNENLHVLLREHSDIWNRYEEEIRSPVRFNRADLIELIHDFAAFVQRGTTKRSSAITHLKLEDKNRVNRISDAYFSDLQRHSMPHFDQMRTFLENPRNVDDLNLYRDTADDLRGQLRTLLTQKTVASLEEGFDYVRDQFIASDNTFKGKRRWIRVFVDYMYSTCDVGKNADTAQTPQT